MVNLIKFRDAIFFNRVMGLYMQSSSVGLRDCSTRVNVRFRKISLSELNLTYEMYHMRILFFLKETYEL